MDVKNTWGLWDEIPWTLETTRGKGVAQGPPGFTFVPPGDTALLLLTTLAQEPGGPGCRTAP